MWGAERRRWWAEKTEAAQEVVLVRAAARTCVRPRVCRRMVARGTAGPPKKRRLSAPQPSQERSAPRLQHFPQTPCDSVVEAAQKRDITESRGIMSQPPLLEEPDRELRRRCLQRAGPCSCSLSWPDGRSLLREIHPAPPCSLRGLEPRQLAPIFCRSGTEQPESPGRQTDTDSQHSPLGTNRGGTGDRKGLISRGH